MRSIERITPDLVGRHLGISAATVRKGMEDGTLPIGIVESNGKKKNFIILPKALYEVTGIKLNGYEPPVTVSSIDYAELARSITAEFISVIRKGEAPC